MKLKIKKQKSCILTEFESYSGRMNRSIKQIILVESYEVPYIQVFLIHQKAISLNSTSPAMTDGKRAVKEEAG